jgi:site-specific DNA recombinase
VRRRSRAYTRINFEEGKSAECSLHQGDYDDPAYSGGHMDRPALQRLLADIAAGEVEIVVVYKIDHLTHSLTDFSRMIEVFERHGVSFVSVTQQFNTTFSMGRLMLNILLSFAQFEREVTGERIRDKIAASKRKGLWMGGVPPLGYDGDSRRLLPNEPEGKIVRHIFKRFVELGSSTPAQGARPGQRWPSAHPWFTRKR